MRDYPKRIKRALREWAAEAHERELHREWREGQLSSSALTELIHRFHNGPARELHNRYNSGYEDMNVAAALAAGILTREEMPAEVVEAIEDLMGFHR
jgi:urease accessory protein UreF